MSEVPGGDHSDTAGEGRFGGVEVEGEGQSLLLPLPTWALSSPTPQAPGALSSQTPAPCSGCPSGEPPPLLPEPGSDASVCI